MNDRYSRAMSREPLGDDATMRQRMKAFADNQQQQRSARTEAFDMNVAARADWEALRDRSCTPMAAVLRIHRPYLSSDEQHVGCTGCIEADGCEDVRNADWPCDTYKAIREVAV